jgi:hypothetical protein
MSTAALHHRTGWRIAVAAAALAAIATGCGTELAPAPSDIGQDVPAPTTTSEVAVPPSDSGPCAPSIREAKQQHRALCVS